MMKRIVDVLSKGDPRIVWGGMVLVAVLLAFEGWHLVLRAPLAQYGQQREMRGALAAAVAASPAQSSELGRAAAEVQKLAEQLKGELRAPQSDDQLTAIVMTELDRSAQASGVSLKAVKPARRRAVATFEELSYEVLAEGRYLMLTRWLLELESALGSSAAVTEFTLKATAESGHVTATLTVALYRPAPAPTPAAAQAK